MRRIARTIRNRLLIGAGHRPHRARSSLSAGANLQAGASPIRLYGRPIGMSRGVTGVIGASHRSIVFPLQAARFIREELPRSAPARFFCFHGLERPVSEGATILAEDSGCCRCTGA